MHERNPYKTPIDFASLSKDYPRLKAFLTNPAGADSEGLTIDFKNAEAQRCLTEALLSRDFQLKFSLPEGRLCPPVPNRLNYILWIQDILSESFRCLEKRPEVVGIDIGTGASAIYPLLGCKVDPSWKFIGTEIDSVSYASAVKNVEQNNLANRIRISKIASPDLILMPFQDEPKRNFTFTMCNPPFYWNAKEIERSAEEKALEPNSVCTGAEVEMMTLGGEEMFVQRMFMESVSSDVKDRCIWFTSMLGKLSSVEAIVGVLRMYNIDNYALTELVQGQTRRWVVGWSLGDARVPDDLARNLPSAHHALLPLPNNYCQVIRNSSSIDLAAFREAVLSVLAALDGVTVVDEPVEGGVASIVRTSGSSGTSATVARNEGSLSLRVSAVQNTWSRAARRAGNAKSVLASGNSVIMIMDISAVHKRLKVGERWVLVGAWRRGKERELFESFWSHVSKKVDAAIEARAVQAEAAGPEHVGSGGEESLVKEKVD